MEMYHPEGGKKMARQLDIQYVRFYTAGTAARKVDIPAVPARPERPATLPKPRVRQRKRQVICVDPVAMCAVVVAAVLFVAMAVGVVELAGASKSSQKMESYTAKLQAENAQLQEIYDSGYDLADIQEKALAMGMVPVTQVPHITVQVPVTETEPELTFWQQLSQTIRELFA